MFTFTTKAFWILKTVQKNAFKKKKERVKRKEETFNKGNIII